MWSRMTVLGLAVAALMQGAAWAQDSSSKDEDPNQVMPQKIREKLSEQGFRDIKVAPGSYVVSARDQDGHRVMMLIGPTETTMMRMPKESPSQAQTPDKDEIIQQ
jgi:hypothetical protein